MRIATAQLASPVGEVHLFATGTGLCALGFEPAELRASLVRRFGAAVDFVPEPDPHGACAALVAYLGGALHALDALPVDVVGTPFQRAVWAALRRVPVGTTSTYGRIAQELGRGGAVRAVGMANHVNPVGIVVPCHRVIASDGGLHGYASGVERKRWLLVHERALLA